MKLNQKLKLGAKLILACTIITFSSCKKEYESGDVIEDSFTGNVNVTSNGQDPAGDFTGSGDGGSYSFAWNNPQNKASVDFDITTNTGSVQMLVEDSEGTVVLDKTRSAGGNDSYSGVTATGVSGIWKVTLVIVDFNGDGSYNLSPGS